MTDPPQWEEGESGRAHDRSKRRRALYGVLRPPRGPAHPPDHGHRRIDALVGGGLLPAAGRGRALRDPLRVGYAKLVSRGEVVFVEESAESVSALDGGRWQVRAMQLRGRWIGRLG